MIQLRWGDETEWKNCPWLKNLEQARREWAETKANPKAGKLPPDPEFREVPDHD